MVAFDVWGVEAKVRFLLRRPKYNTRLVKLNIIPVYEIGVTGLNPVLGANIAAVAHQVEQQTENLCVAGSSPARGTKRKSLPG
jgi:hypothetical protein